MKERKPRRHFTAQQKVIAVKRHLVEGEAVSDICEALDLHPNQPEFKHRLKITAKALDAGHAITYIQPGSGYSIMGNQLASKLTALLSDDNANPDNGNTPDTGDTSPKHLQGTDGNDTLQDGLGNDLLEGCKGNDTYRYTAGADIIKENGGIDKLIFGNGISFSQVGNHLMKPPHEIR